jgi:hypothetical protein
MNPLSFIKKNIPIKLQKRPLNDLSKILIGKIVHQMELAVNSWKLNQTYQEHILGPEEFPKDHDYDYIVEEIRDEIERKKKVGKRYSFKIGSRTFTIYAIYPYSGNLPANLYQRLDAAIRRMYIWLFIADHFSESECSPHLSIYWYLTKHKKVLPRENCVIDRVHVNTGFTMACPTSANSLYIFREEEWFKVLIHESFHSLGLDFAKMSEDLANRAMFSIFPVHCDLRFAEAYTECWAEIIHVIFLSVSEYPCKDTAVDIHKLIKTIEHKMTEERMFSLFQLSKVLKHNHLEYTDLFSPNSYKESSNVFSYYVLKSIFIFFYDEFIEWTTVNNRGTISFKKTQRNVLSLVEFIKTHCKNDEFMRVIDSIQKKAVPDGPEMQTLRMSISE